jgi:hypothetical protein
MSGKLIKVEISHFVRSEESKYFYRTIVTTNT